MNSLRVPAAVRGYYGRDVHAIIVQQFPRRRMNGSVGWVSTSYRKRVSVSWARKLLREGVTHVALVPVDDPRRAPADFSLEEIIRGGSESVGGSCEFRR